VTDAQFVLLARDPAAYIRAIDEQTRRHGIEQIFGPGRDRDLYALSLSDLAAQIWEKLDADPTYAPFAHFVARALDTFVTREFAERFPALSAELDRRVDLTSAPLPVGHIPAWRFRSRHEALAEIFGSSDLGDLWRLSLNQIGQLIWGALRRDPALVAPETTFATALGYTDLDEFRTKEPDLVAELTERAHRLSSPPTEEPYVDL
jgi:hypothetical protein